MESIFSIQIWSDIFVLGFCLGLGVLLASIIMAGFHFWFFRPSAGRSPKESHWILKVDALVGLGGFGLVALNALAFSVVVKVPFLEKILTAFVERSCWGFRLAGCIVMAICTLGAIAYHLFTVKRIAYWRHYLKTNPESIEEWSVEYWVREWRCSVRVAFITALMVDLVILIKMLFPSLW